MEYTRTSVKPVIAKIIRDVGRNNLDPGYIDSILEWIPESMEELQTTHEMVTKSTPDKDCEGAVYTKNHSAVLPKGMVYLRAVEDEYGKRIRRGTDETDLTHQSTQAHTGHQGPFAGRSTNFQADASEIVGGVPDDPTNSVVPWDGSDLTQVDNTQVREYYKLQGGCIQTLSESTFIKLHYDCLPTDSEGYPLIVDLHEYREAIYWYVLGKLIAAGFEHKLFTGMQGYNYTHQKYEEYASLALGKIKLPDMDRMARLRDSFSLRLVPPYHFYEDFSVGGEQVQPIRMI
jgi:hypothetical protein